MTSVFDKKIQSDNTLDHTHKIQKRAMKAGFAWKSIEGVFAKIEEELAEVREAYIENDKQHLKEEVGDLLFAVTKLASYLELSPEEALEGCNMRFINRFKFMEKYMVENYEGAFKTHDVEEILKGWAAAKKVHL